MVHPYISVQMRYCQILNKTGLTIAGRKFCHFVNSFVINKIHYETLVWWKTLELQKIQSPKEIKSTFNLELIIGKVHDYIFTIANLDFSNHALGYHCQKWRGHSQSETSFY